jgi:hypothetical protein
VTIRYEGAYAERTIVEAVPAGEELGGDVLDRPALAFNYDEVFFVVGSAPELVAFTGRVQAAARRLATPSAGDPASAGTGARGHSHRCTAPPTLPPSTGVAP